VRAREVLRALPPDVEVDERDIEAAEAEGQVRVWFKDTPIDLFLDLHDFHTELAGRRAVVPFEAREIPVLQCTDLAVFKVLFDRTRDWADIEDMLAAGTLDIPRVQASVERFSGVDAPGIARLQKLSS
jgi:hypothetical protein